jgi:hypothetical protein
MRDLNAQKRRRASRTSDIQSIYGRAGLVVRQYRSLNAAAKKDALRGMAGSRKIMLLVHSGVLCRRRLMHCLEQSTAAHMNVYPQHWRSFRCHE